MGLFIGQSLWLIGMATDQGKGFAKEVSKTKFKCRNIVFLTLLIPGHTESPHLEKEGQSIGREGN